MTGETLVTYTRFAVPAGSMGSVQGAVFRPIKSKIDFTSPPSSFHFGPDVFQSKSH